jgi:hypothetical protein
MVRGPIKAGSDWRPLGRLSHADHDNGEVGKANAVVHAGCSAFVPSASSAVLGGPNYQVDLSSLRK